MTRSFRHPLVQRVFVALFTLAFLPAVSWAYACEAACLFGPDGTVRVSAHGVPHEAASRPARHEAPLHPGSGTVKHGSSCHLTAIPAAPPGVPTVALPGPAQGWTHPSPNGFYSCIWPPPEHRPRA